MATPIPIAKPNSSGTGRLIALATGPTFVDGDEDGNPLNGSVASTGDESEESDNNDDDQEFDQDLDGDLNQKAEELDEFGEPLRAAEAEQSEWDEQP